MQPETGKVKWTSSVSKQVYFRQLVQRCVSNQLTFNYILADSWFSSAENFRFITQLNKHFIMPLKANRKVALSEADHHRGRYQSIGLLSLEEHQSLVVWVESVDFPPMLTKQIFKDGNREQGQLYLVTNDLTTDSICIQMQYARRWKVEEFHKSVKSNAGMDTLLPTRCVLRAIICFCPRWLLSSWKPYGFAHRRIISRSSSCWPTMP